MSRSPEWGTEFPALDRVPELAKSENEEARESFEISEEFLNRFYESDRFLHHLKETSQRVRQFGGRELGFGIRKDLTSDQTIFTDIVGSPYENGVAIRKAHDVLEARLEQTGSKRTFIIFGGLHFHPHIGRDPVIIPSGSAGDLGHSSSDRTGNQYKANFDVPTTEMIAVHLVSNEMKILVYQEPLLYKPLDRVAIKEEIDDTLLSFQSANGVSQEDVTDGLRHYGYKVDIVRTSQGEFPRAELNKLRRFAFVPKRLEG